MDFIKIQTSERLIPQDLQESLWRINSTHFRDTKNP